MLLGMGLVAVPQAMAGGSALENWKLPWGMQFGKPIPAKVELRRLRKGKCMIGNNGVCTHTLNRVLSSVGFRDKSPRVFRSLGVVISEDERKGTSGLELQRIMRQQGGKLFEINKDDGSFSATFGSSPYLFFFNCGSSGLGSIWVSEQEEDF